METERKEGRKEGRKEEQEGGKVFERSGVGVALASHRLAISSRPDTRSVLGKLPDSVGRPVVTDCSLQPEIFQRNGTVFQLLATHSTAIRAAGYKYSSRQWARMHSMAPRWEYARRGHDSDRHRLLRCLI